MKFKVTYEHEVVITYEAIVEAGSEVEAKQKISEGSIISEEETEYQGMEIRIKNIENF